MLPYLTPPFTTVVSREIVRNDSENLAHHIPTKRKLEKIHILIFFLYAVTVYYISTEWKKYDGYNFPFLNSPHKPNKSGKGKKELQESDNKSLPWQDIIWLFQFSSDIYLANGRWWWW